MSVITEDNLRRLVDLFYDRVRADPMLGPIFNPAIGDWPAHLAKLHAFWSSVMLTSGRYKGQPMAAHLAHGDAMTPETFGRWLELWRETTNALFEPELAAAFQKKAGRIAESLRLALVYRDGIPRPATRQERSAIMRGTSPACAAPNEFGGDHG